MPYGKFGGVEFSDRFIAIKSNTTRNGNSLKAPAQAIHEFGLIPKYQLPKKENMSWEEYHDKNNITEEMENLGKEFLKRFTIQYERSYNLYKSVQDDYVATGVYAWPDPENGVYPHVDWGFNHCVVVTKPQYFVFDNYLDTDGDFIKHLAPDFNFFQYGYRICLTGQNSSYEKKSNNWLIDLIRQLQALIRELYVQRNKKSVA